jgi:hypothetical protein
LHNRVPYYRYYGAQGYIEPKEQQLLKRAQN